MAYTKFPKGREKPYVISGKVSAEKHDKYLEIKGDLKNQDVLEFCVDLLIDGSIDLTSLRIPKVSGEVDSPDTQKPKELNLEGE